MKQIIILLVSLFLLVGCTAKSTIEENTIELQNPIIPGYFADPSLVQYEGKFYLYVTADPWGADFLSCWVSDDFQDWTFHTLNWPTKEACTSPTSRANMVWAPSVIQKGDAFYMYISVGSEIWCGKANHPLGPWENMLDGVPMISDDPTGYYHVIDAETFIDDNGKAYLYWGSGWDWINGHCFAAELNDDMCSFKNEPVEVTPTRYFEGPLMIKHQEKYYLTYSEGKTIDETYEVRYAVGDNPFGPFTEAENSPILKSNDNLRVYGPGHHTLFTYDNKNYILYHKHRLPFKSGSAYRQTCIREFTFNDAKDEINTIIPYHTQTFPDLRKEKKQVILPQKIEASSIQAEYTKPENILDNHYGTRWESDENDKNANIAVIFSEENHIEVMEIRFEYPWKKYFMKVEFSANGNDWKTVADYTDEGISGSPVNIAIDDKCKQIKISFVETAESAKPSIWELRFY